MSVATRPTMEQLLRLVADLGGTPLILRAEDKALYHAAAVLASNYVVTLAKLATDLWLRLGQERPAALKALLPLIQGAVDNLNAVGLPAALTGPIARGDVPTVRRHLEALADAAPSLQTVYRDLALETIPVALARGGLSEAAAIELRDLLVATRFLKPGTLRTPPEGAPDPLGENRLPSRLEAEGAKSQ